MADKVSRTAYHEAGHAVMAWSLHQAVGRVTIVPSKSYAGEAILPIPKWFVEGNSGPDRALLWAIKHVMAIMAGYEVVRQRFEEDVSWVHSSDFRDEIGFCDSVTSGPNESEVLLDWLRERTAATIREGLTRFQIELVAAALEMKKTLSGREVRQLCGMGLRLWVKSKGQPVKSGLTYDEKQKQWRFEEEAQNAHVQDHE